MSYVPKIVAAMSQKACNYTIYGFDNGRQWQGPEGEGLGQIIFTNFRYQTLVIGEVRRKNEKSGIKNHTCEHSEGCLTEDEGDI